MSRREVRAIMWLRAAVGLAGLSSCGLGTGPTYRLRVLELRGDLRAVAPATTTASGPVYVALQDARGGCNTFQGLGWHVRGTGLSGPPSAVHLHEGSPAAPGRVLYDVPIVGIPTLPEVVTASRNGYERYEGQFAGPLPFGELFDTLAGRERYLDVHVGGASTPELVGELASVRASGWRSVPCGSS